MVTFVARYVGTWIEVLLWRRNKNSAAVTVGPLAVMLLLGAVVGCNEERVIAPDIVPIPIADPAPALEERITMPGGWRNLQFGMSEMDAKKAIHDHRTNANVKWTPSSTTNLTTVRFDLRKIDNVAVDEKRFREWSIRELDEGAKSVRAWFDDGKLVGIQVDGTATLDAFLRKATEAYAAAPRNAAFTFFDHRIMSGEVRNVAFWRGNDVTAFIWASPYVPNGPTLLLWSNAAMDKTANLYQTALDAPAATATKAARISENETKF